MNDYRIDVHDTAGARQFVLTDFENFAVNRRVNGAGFLQVQLRGDHPLMAAIGDKWRLKVWQKPEGGVWRREFSGIYRQPEYRYGERARVMLYCVGELGLLGWREILWRAGTANRSAFQTKAAETIAKTLVDYNAGANATAGNGRIRTGTISGISIEADGGGGNTLDWYCAYDNLLESLQKLAQVGGGDYDLVETGVNTWEFRWYAGQLGTDRTASVVFALGYGNMGSPMYRETRLDEKTVAIVAGQGEGAYRQIAIRTGANYAAGNDIELFVNASDVDTDTGLNDRGDQKLVGVEAREAFEFEALQTEKSRYGVDYFLGDLVTAINPFSGAELTLKLVGVSIAFNEDGSEQIKPEMANP